MPPLISQCHPESIDASHVSHHLDQRGDLPHLMARKDLTEEFKNKMLCDNPVRFYRLSEGDIAAARRAKGI
jgi:hypothetical protein